ncbi:GatB/YqeY domain-containing protein [Patescibacteria group bacterium]|nr:GatB/YqeY domain-containing protein [Patescibacteria group bacterium]
MLKQKLEDDLKTTLKAGDSLRVSTLRLVLAAVANREIELGKKDVGLSDEEILKVLRSEVKKRKDAEGQFRKGGREDLAKKEGKEAEILETYLPREMSDIELEQIILQSVREAGYRTQADFGKAMKAAMAGLKGRAGGERVAKAVKKALGV